MRFAHDEWSKNEKMGRRMRDGSYTRQHMFKRIFAGIIAAGAVFVFGTTLTHALLYSSDSELIATNDAPPVVTNNKNNSPDSYPVKIIIPSLSIEANVQYVGVTSHGTMSVPNNFTDAGWYRYGTVPGESGAAVMAGHVDNALALPGVFKRLPEIQPGADIYVVTKGGTKLHFIVDDTGSYTPEEAPTERIFEETGPARLNLITCEGTWVQSERQYDHRFVVYSHLVQ